MAIRKTQLQISGMHCASCVLDIESDVKKLPGVKEVNVNFALERGEVTYDDTLTSEAAIVAAIKRTGYRASALAPALASASHTVHGGPGGHGGEQGTVQQAPAHPVSHGSHHGNGGAAVGGTNHDEHAGHAQAESAAELRGRWQRFLVAATLSAGVVALTLGPAVPGRHVAMLLLSLGVLAAGREFFALGLPGLVRGRPNMDTLVALGVGAAFLYSSYVTLFIPDASEYFLDVAIISTFILLGRYLEARAKGRASEAIRKLLKLSPKITHRLRGEGGTEDVPAAAVAVGDLLLVKPGEQVPTDGAVTEGASAIDESMVTGESIPADKTVGDKVIGATVNGNGTFTMRAEKVGTETVLSQIVRLVEQAQMSKAPIQKLVDKVSRYFVWAVIVVAVATAAVWLLVTGDFARSLVYAVTVLIVACPCALGLATPISIVVGAGRGASLGILIKKAEALEKMKKITAVAFDKTGTITVGHPTVQEWVATYDKAEAYFSELYTLESRSEHPLARAVIDWAKNRAPVALDVPLANVKAVAGRGMSGEYQGATYRVGSWRFLAEQGVVVSEDDGRAGRYREKGYTVIGFARDRQLLGFFAVQDGVKESSATAVRALKDRGVRTVMLTGDNEAVAREIARQVGIDEVKAEVLPADKVAAIKELQTRGAFVAMVGDGINDSPALAQADVGIAMGTGTDVAMEAGDVVLVKGDLSKAVEAMALSAATLRNIKQNLFWAFIYNAVGVPVAALGFLNPAVSAAAMALSSISVVLNALRLKRVRIG